MLLTASVVFLASSTTFILVSQAAYPLVTDRGTVGVRLADTTGNEVSATTGMLDDYGRSMPVQTNELCSSLLTNTLKVSCSQITNKQPLFHELMVARDGWHIPDRYIPPKFTQPAFAAVATKRRIIDPNSNNNNNDNYETTSNNNNNNNNNNKYYSDGSDLIDRDYYNSNKNRHNKNNHYDTRPTQLDASYYKQMLDEHVTELLMKPLKHAQWVNRAKDRNERLEIREKLNNENTGKNNIKKGKDPNILLNSMGKVGGNVVKTNRNNELNSENKLFKTSTLARSEYGSEKVLNGIFGGNAGNNGMNIPQGVTFYTVNADGTFSEQNIGGNKGKNGDGNGEIQPMMDAAISQLVANALKNRKEDETTVVEMTTDPEQMAEELRKLMIEKLQAGGNEIDPSQIEFQLEIVYDTDTNNNNINNNNENDNIEDEFEESDSDTNHEDNTNNEDWDDF